MIRAAARYPVPKYPAQRRSQGFGRVVVLAAKNATVMLVRLAGTTLVLNNDEWGYLFVNKLSRVRCFQNTLNVNGHGLS